MAIIGSIIGAILQSLGRIFSFLFGWAIISFFGKMPAKKQYLLSSIAVLSLAWWFLVVSRLWPPFLNLLVEVRPQIAAQSGLLSWITWPGIIGLPLVIGVLTLFVDIEPPPGVGGKAKQIMQGYLVAPGFGLAMLIMLVTAAGLVLYKYIRGVKVEHVPIQLKQGGYDRVVHDLTTALAQGKIPVDSRPLPWVLRPPEWILSLLASTILQGIAPENPCMLVGKDHRLSIVLHPADIAISARGKTAAYVRAVVTTNMPFTAAYLTWEKAAQAYEEKLFAMWQQFQQAQAGNVCEAIEEIDHLKGEIYVKDIPYDQWEVLYREMLQLEDSLVIVRVRSTGCDDVRMSGMPAHSMQASLMTLSRIRRIAAAATVAVLSLRDRFRSA